MVQGDRLLPAMRCERRAPLVNPTLHGLRPSCRVARIASPAWPLPPCPFPSRGCLRSSTTLPCGSAPNPAVSAKDRARGRRLRAMPLSGESATRCVATTFHNSGGRGGQNLWASGEWEPWASLARDLCALDLSPLASNCEKLFTPARRSARRTGTGRLPGHSRNTTRPPEGPRWARWPAFPRVDKGDR